MTNFKHTPGPWHQDYSGNGNVWSNDCKVADTGNPRQAGQYREPDDAERIANGRLIAAAPDLLMVAKLILERGYVSSSIEEERNDHIALVAAIAKATGAA